MSEIIIYTSKNNETSIDVKFEGETVWLNQQEISQLFGRERSVITKHLKNIFSSGELEEKGNVHFLHITNSDKPVKLYNLDVIISVGYRVNSVQGTQFRIWATKQLKQFLLKGYAINEKRLIELKQIVSVIQNSHSSLNSNEKEGLLEILANYTKSFVLLNQFDSNNFSSNQFEENISYEIKYAEAIKAIAELKNQLIAKNEATELFGNQKDKSFEGVLISIIQTFDGNYLYPTIEEQSAHLLYFVIKNHPFSDGNKRIGAFLFIWFLEKNKHRFKKNGEIKINDNALVTLAILVAQSNPNDKDLMVQLICNLISN